MHELLNPPGDLNLIAGHTLLGVPGILLLCGSTRVLHVSWTHAPLVGWSTVTVTARSASGQVYQASARVLTFPLIPVGAALMVLIGLTLLAWSRCGRRTVPELPAREAGQHERIS